MQGGECKARLSKRINSIWDMDTASKVMNLKDICEMRVAQF
jgi:hypothetical protein